MSKNQELQEIINHIHLEFKESDKSQELLQWDALISLVVNRDFEKQKAETFLDAHACLLGVFANELIEFVLSYFVEESRGV